MKFMNILLEINLIYVPILIKECLILFYIKNNK